MKKRKAYFLTIVSVIFVGCLIFFTTNCNKVSIGKYSSIDQLPNIKPDYNGTVIPLNIAPLNFLIQEEGTSYFVKIYSGQSQPIEICSNTPKISIPENAWHKLLDQNRGQELFFEIYTKGEDKKWSLFKPITNKIADEPIDAWLVYRKIHPSHNTWREMGLFQRNLQNFNESPILKNDRFRYGCAHCHTFCNNNAEKMAIGIRSGEYKSGLLIVEGDEIYKIGQIFGFVAWHPSEKLFACTINKPKLILHPARNEVRDIVDLDSWLGYYSLETKRIRTIPELSQKNKLENYPNWSPDGKYLYFCSAEMLWTDRNTVPPVHYNEAKYDLLRISYDIENDRWGEVETVLLAKVTGLSINQPRISSDGRWLTFSMCEYGCWPSYHPSSDLYIIDLKAAEQTAKFEYRKMEINSDECESWHTWSSNSKWIVFSSKKDNPLFNRSYIAYVNDDGRLSKSLILPQEDPDFYDTYLKTYTIPELVTSPVTAVGEKLARVIREGEYVPLDLTITMATPKIGR
jgi:hypothetical protein